MRKTNYLFIGIITAIIVGVTLFNFCSIRENDHNQNETTYNNYDNENTQIPNPAGYYCHIILEYKSRINETKEGQVGICIFPDGSECTQWDFYAGLCGQNWSYCEQHGYVSKIKNDTKDNYSGAGTVVCVNKSTGVEIGKVSELSNLTRSLSRSTDSNLPTG